jgi:histidyl-tRNA synthetase
MDKIQAVKGTRDFYPEALALRNFIEAKVRAASQAYGYQEWDGPFIEPLELYAAKSGDELVKKQSFVFEDRGGEQVALRPELTPSLARMIAARQNELTLPLRWWSFGPFWRYEQPQRGRTREFFQWNIDLLGADSPEADAELIAVGASFLRSVGLVPSRAEILVNDRRLMNAQFEGLGIPAESRKEVAVLVDRHSKLKPDAWEKEAIGAGLTAKQVEGLKGVLANFELWTESEELKRLFAALDALGVREYVRFDPTIMRGLLYYTGTVFEAYDTGGSVKRAIFGGGRYDNLLADVGGQQVPAVGFAMGDVVIGILLQESGLVPAFGVSPAPVLVTVFDDSLWLKSYALAADLRRAGLDVAVYPEPAKLPKQLKFADKLGMRVAIVLGPEEAANDQLAVKNLSDGTQQLVSRLGAAEVIRAILASARP